jgi:hypothetical protein
MGRMRWLAKIPAYFLKSVHKLPLKRTSFFWSSVLAGMVVLIVSVPKLALPDQFITGEFGPPKSPYTSADERLDPSISGSARIERFRALQETTVERIRAILNEEQRRKYDPLASRRVQAAPPRRSVEDWLNATIPQSTTPQ